MKKFIFTSFIFLMVSKYAFSQLSLEIEIAEIKNDAGNIMLQLFDEKEKVISQEMSAIKDKKCTISFKNLKPGKYAIRYFHDENNNGELDTNRLGIPKEGYGFSNNASGRFGPPPFEKWIFELKENMKMVLKPIN